MSNRGNGYVGHLATYKRQQESNETPRQREVRALLHVNRLMSEAAERNDRVALIKACTENRLLWNTFRADVLEPGNRLSDEAKAGIITLSLYVDKVTEAVTFRGAGPEDLIAINGQLVEGLRVQPAASPDAAAAPPPASTATSA